MRSDKGKDFFLFLPECFLYACICLCALCGSGRNDTGLKKLIMILVYNDYLETSSQRGPLSVASRKTASISDLILRSAKVS